MNGALELEIREQLQSYLAGSSDLSALSQWIAEHTWNVRQVGNEAASVLTYAIEGLLASHDVEDLTIDELTTELRNLLGQPTMIVFGGSMQGTKTASQVTVATPQVDATVPVTAIGFTVFVPGVPTAESHHAVPTARPQTATA